MAEDIENVRTAWFWAVHHREAGPIYWGGLGLAEVPSALAYAREGLAIATELGHVVFMASNLCALADATLRQQGVEASRGYLDQALDMAEKAQLWPFLMLARFHLGTLLAHVAESASDPASRRQQRDQALALLADVCRHPSSWSLVRERADRLQEALARALTSVQEEP